MKIQNAETIQSYFTRVSQIKEQLEVVVEEVENAKVVIMASQDHGIHSFEECMPEGSDYFQQTLGRAHTRRSSTHNKRKEDGSN